MKKRAFFASLAVLAVSLLWVMPPSVHGEIFIKQKNHTDAHSIMGQSMPAKDEATITWLAKDKVRIDIGEQSSVILRMDLKKLYRLDNTASSYQEVPFGFVNDMMSALSAGAGKEGAPDMAAALATFKATVTPTDEKKKIKDWACSKYIFELQIPVGTVTTEIWTTEDIKIDYDLYRAAANALVSDQPGFAQIWKELKKVKGITVQKSTKTAIMGTEINATEELVEAGEKAAPKGVFEIPQGYKKVDALPKQGPF